MSASNEELARRAADPTSGWETLQQIVADHPELRAEVAANPAAYPELLDWLAELGDPGVDAALDARGWSPAGADSTDTNPTEALDVREARDEAGIWRGAPDRTGPAAAAAGAADGPVFPPSGPSSPPTGGPTRLPVRQRMTPNDSTWSHAPATRSTWTEHAAPGTAAAAGAPIAAPAHAPAGSGVGAGTDADAQPPEGSSVFPGDGSPAERRRPPIALLAVALAVVILAIFAVTQLLGGRDGTDTAAGEPAPTAEATPTGTPAGDDPATESTPTSPADLVRPAPQDAVQAARFSSPSSNIVCALATEGLRCTILEHDFPGPDGCVGGPTTVSLDADGDVTRSCDGAGVSPASLTLEYGASATFGSGACTSTPDGMSCWDMRTGTGFTLARAGISED